MSTVIEEISIDLRGRSDQYLSDFDPGNYRLRLRGYTTDLFDRTTYDGFIIQSTGLESISMDVQGGSVYYGGSVFTGSRAQDREVVLTVNPMGSTSNTIKATLNRLMSLSNKTPLTMTVVVRATFADGRVESVRHTAIGFLSNVTSSIFDKDPKIQLTMKLGDPTFKRDPMIYSGSNPYGDFISEGTPQASYGYYAKSSSLIMGRSLMLHTAPGAFQVIVRVAYPHVEALREIRVYDAVGNHIRFVAGSQWQTKHGGAANVRFLFDGDTRSFLMSKNDMSFASTDSAFHYTTHGGWPELRPGTPAFTVTVESTTENAVHTIPQLVYRTGVYGF